MMFALIGQCDTIEFTIASVEFEGAQIDPCASTHLLIDTELGTFALVPHGIERIFYTIWKRLIADIDSITACLLDAWLISGNRISFITAGGIGHTGCTSLKGIFIVLVMTCVHHESWLWRRLPFAMRCNFNIVVFRTVVVNDNLLGLPIALTRREDDSPSTFKHRYEVGYNNSLSKQVLSGTK